MPTKQCMPPCHSRPNGLPNALHAIVPNTCPTRAQPRSLIRPGIHHARRRQFLPLLLRLERLDPSQELRIWTGLAQPLAGHPHRCRRSLPGMTSSMRKGARLKGSLGSLSRCDRMVDRSIDTLDVGRITGSFIRSNINGSRSRKVSRAVEPTAQGTGRGRKRKPVPRNSSGMTPRSSSACSSASFAFLNFSPNLVHADIASGDFNDHRRNNQVASSTIAGLYDLPSRATAKTKLSLSWRFR